MQINDKNIYVNKKSLVFRSYIIYVDVVLKDREINLGQKINSFFGQIGIFEGTEIIFNFLNNYFKSIFLENLMFYDFDSNFDFFEEATVFLPLVLIFYFDEKKVDFFVKPSWLKNLTFYNLKYKLINNYIKIIKDSSILIKNINYYKNIFSYSIHLKNFMYSSFSKNIFNLFLKKFSFKFFVDEDLYNVFFDEYVNYNYKKKKKNFFFKKIKIKK